VKRSKSYAWILLAAGFEAGLGACCASPPAADSATIVVSGKVTDVAAFERFIATRPTPAQFHARYPDVRLVLPGEIATKEYRLDNSRYFASLDGEGRIQGGSFK
jgi:hypothetical protein